MLRTSRGIGNGNQGTQPAHGRARLRVYAAASLLRFSQESEENCSFAAAHIENIQEQQKKERLLNLSLTGLPATQLSSLS
jgi:hypothetical protein